MIIYSPISPELIWQDSIESGFKLVEDSINGIKIQIMITHDKTARIERILSTDPQDYLNLRYQPGRFIDYQPALIDSVVQQ